MSNPLHAAYYADSALYRTVSVVENIPVAQDTFRLRMECPQMAARILPGQFLMVRLTGFDDPLIGRPLALYDTYLSDRDQPQGIDVVYLVKGKFTTRLAEFLPGQRVDVWGPLGNGFYPQPARHLIMVAGGIGQTPFVALAQESLGRRKYGQPPREVAPAQKVTMCYGARTLALLAGIEDFERIGVDLRLATDDGTRGHHGFVSELLEQVLSENELPCRVVSCGPEPMMAAVSEIAARENVDCQVSLETPMACGIGICFTCVARVRDENGDWDYKRTCVEGPVFDAEKIVW